MSGPLAVLSNPASTANRRGRPLDLPAGVLRAAPESPEALSETLAEWQRAGVGTIAVDGGDGTVRELLSRLPEAFADPPPLALLPRGNTNLFARVIGSWPGERGLCDLRGGGVIRPHPVLSVSGISGGRRRGLILGLGAYTRATELAAGQTSRGVVQVGTAVVGGLFRLLSSASERGGEPLTMEIDGEATPAGNRLLIMVTVAEGRLVPGIEPFWGGGTGPLRWLDVLAPGRWLLLAAPFGLTGRPRRWMDGAGYRSGRTSEITIRTEALVVLDGEVFQPGEDGLLRISVETWPRFLVPAGGRGR